eukprot:352387-Prorocentrum_minimum.AAC.3
MSTCDIIYTVLVGHPNAVLRVVVLHHLRTCEHLARRIPGLFAMRNVARRHSNSENRRPKCAPCQERVVATGQRGPRGGITLLCGNRGQWRERPHVVWGQRRAHMRSRSC